MTANPASTAAQADAAGRTRPGAGISDANPTEADTAPKPIAPRNLVVLDMPPCDGCGALADDGCLAVDIDAASLRVIAFRAWRKSGGSTTGHPPPPLVPWWVLCANCKKARDRKGTRTIAWKTIRTDRRLLRKTLDLAPQPWCKQTDWHGLVRRILAAQDG